ncbi:MAG: metal ABC transporter solute-binding protein, Zn/Mn family [Phycisphaeraceae bacterium JB051]
MYKAQLFIGAIFLGLICFSQQGCEKKLQEVTVTAYPFDVVATYSILGDIVKQVGGQQVQVKTLVGAGGDAHTYEPTPSDSVSINKAVLLFENGLEFETWLDKLYKASGSDAKRIVVSKNLKPRRLDHEEDEHADHEENHEDHADHDHDEHDHADHDEHDHHHHHGEFDPHIWHDVTNVISMVKVVAKALQDVDPSNVQQYQTNADQYIAQLTDLDTWIKEQVQKIPASNRKLVTTHDTFSYFAQRYGFEVISVMGSVSSEIADPSAADVARVVDQVKSFGVPAIFAENILSPKMTKQIAQQAGVQVVATLYTDALGKPGTEGQTYIKMVRHNVNTMVKALAQ